MPTTSRRTAGILATTLGVTIWGASSTMVKSIDGIDGPGIAFHRLLIGAAVLVVVHLARGGRITWSLLRVSAFGGIAFGLDIVLFFSALRETSVANATVIGALQPILLAPIGIRLFGEQLGRRTLVWSAVAVAGTVVVVLGATGLPAWSLRGDLLAVGALLSWTAYFVASKQARQQLGTLDYFTGLSVVASVVIAPYALVVGADLSPAGPSDWVTIVVVTVLSGALGHVLLNWSHEHVPLQVVSLLTLLVPVVATVGAVTFLDERVTGLQWLGMAAVVAALAVVVLERPARRELREVGEPVPT
jgi:drug/metabolite transporter (DMT)-like permease